MYVHGNAATFLVTHTYWDPIKSGHTGCHNELVAATQSQSPVVDDRGRKRSFMAEKKFVMILSRTHTLQIFA